MAQTKNTSAQKLIITEKFYDKLSKGEDEEILALYGFDDADSFLWSVIKNLNDNYNFLNIEDFDFMSDKKAKTFRKYNGYISGEFEHYNEVLVSFSDVSVKKAGDVIITQQLMPMLARRIDDNPGFMLDDRIKRIFVLCSHKSGELNKSSNIIKDRTRSSTQALVKCLNSMGFDVIEQIPMINLARDASFNALQELVDSMDYFTRLKPSNRSHKYIEFDGQTVRGSFGQMPIGQEQKFFAFRFLTALMLNDGYSYDLSAALEETGDIQIRAIAKMARLINESPYERSFAPQSSVVELAYKLSDTDMSDTKRKITRKENSRATMSYVVNPRIKEEKVKMRGHQCCCNDIRHIYFIGNATGARYVEGHHMIPMNRQSDYEKRGINLDVLQNITPLCPHCHKKIHLGNNAARAEAATAVYETNKHDLLKLDPSLTLIKFFEFYNIVDITV